MNECETLKLGATLVGHNHCNFRVWAPFVDSVDVHIVSPGDRVLSLKKTNSDIMRGFLVK